MTPSCSDALKSATRRRASNGMSLVQDILSPSPLLHCPQFLNTNNIRRVEPLCADFLLICRCLAELVPLAELELASPTQRITFQANNLGVEAQTPAAFVSRQPIRVLLKGVCRRNGGHLKSPPASSGRGLQRLEPLRTTAALWAIAQKKSHHKSSR